MNRSLLGKPKDRHSRQEGLIGAKTSIDMSESKGVELTANGLGQLGPRAAKRLAWRGG